MQLKAGAKAEYNKMGTLTQPTQFLPRSEKNQDWYAWNADWLEWQGLKQIRRKAPRFMKNYKLAKGIIDRSDYIVENDNEFRDLVDIIAKEDSALDLKFYPIIPNVVNTLCSEFAKRKSKISFRGVDEFSHNELLDQKSAQVEQVLIADAQKHMLDAMIQQGLDPEDPEIQQQLSPENIKTLPEIEGYFKKDYRSMCEEWAMHQYEVDVDRFKMEELEERAFRNMLITDSEFWHFKMLEDDYDIELWNPALTFYHKSPESRYVSEGNWVGKIEMMTVADVIDKFGFKMTEDQLTSLESIYPVRSAAYPIQGMQNDGSYYDATRSHAWNTNQPSLAYRQFVSMWDNGGAAYYGGDIINWILGQSEDYDDMGMAFLLRVTTTYWKGQRRVGYLTKIKESGEIVVDIVDEDYEVTDKPVYNTTFIKNKTAETLVFGEHIDWIWINQTQGVVKIGPNRPSWWGMRTAGGVNPMYLGIDQNRMGPLKFQFKGNKTMWGCKLPVEGAVFSDYNTRSTSLVDLMKPFQIGYNLVNNQIADILIDELGTIIVFDPNFLPRHSLGEDWGKSNYAKAFVSMKTFQMLPLDRSLGNIEGANPSTPIQQLNLEQSQRIVSRMNLARYFKEEAFSQIGLNAQRMGQEMGRETAKGVEQNLNASYAQTEGYFIQHSDYLMPRVHQMRTDLAQYYNSTKPSARLQYITKAEERINFEINGKDLELRDINVYCTTKVSDRELLEELKAIAEHNTTGASMSDLGYLKKAESLAELDHVLKDIEEKQNKQQTDEREHAENMQRMKLDAEAKEKQLSRDFEAQQAEENRKKDIFVAEIRAAGYGAAVDKNNNGQNDYLDFLDTTRKSTEFAEMMNFEKGKEDHKQLMNEDKQNIQREKMQTQRELKNIDLKIAEVNKNRFNNKKNSEK